MKTNIQFFAGEEPVVVKEEDNKLEQIKKLKEELEKSVSIEEYNKVMQENKSLVDEYINNRGQDKKEDLKPPITYAQMFLKSDNPMSNRDYIKNALEYRESMLKETGYDVFGDKGVSTEQTEKVARVLGEVLETTEGKAEFRLKMNEVLKDDAVLVASLRNKNRN